MDKETLVDLLQTVWVVWMETYNKLVSRMPLYLKLIKFKANMNIQSMEIWTKLSAQEEEVQEVAVKQAILHNLKAQLRIS